MGSDAGWQRAWARLTQGTSSACAPACSPILSSSCSQAVRSALSSSSCFFTSGPTAAPADAGEDAAPGGTDAPEDGPAAAAAGLLVPTPLPFAVGAVVADEDGGGAAGATGAAPKLNTPAGAPPASFAGAGTHDPNAAGPPDEPPKLAPLLAPNVNDGGGAPKLNPESLVPLAPPKGAPKGGGLPVAEAPKLKHPPAAPDTLAVVGAAAACSAGFGRVSALAAAAAGGALLPKLKTGAAAGAADAEAAGATLPPKLKTAPAAEAGAAGPPKLNAGAGAVVEFVGAGAKVAALPKAPKAKAGAAGAGAGAGAVALNENAPPAGAAVGATSWTFANGLEDIAAGAGAGLSATSIPELGTGRFARRTLRARIVSCGVHERTGINSVRPKARACARWPHLVRLPPGSLLLAAAAFVLPVKVIQVVSLSFAGHVHHTERAAVSARPRRPTARQK